MLPIFLVFLFVVLVLRASSLVKTIVLSIALPAIGLALGGFFWAFAGMMGLASVSLVSFFSYVFGATLVVTIIYVKA